jgi:hypothetical protein
MVLFVLGLGLAFLGISLSVFSQEAKFLQGGATTYPYVQSGAVIIIVGLVSLSIAYGLIVTHRETNS